MRFTLLKVGPVYDLFINYFVNISIIKVFYRQTERTRKSKTALGCFTETVYVEAWCDMQIHESLWEVLYVMKCSLGVQSDMLGRSNFSVYFRYTGRVRNFG